jgi:hypothetical protein
MLKLSELSPINLESEKAKFFAANFQYNPQFIYEKTIEKTELTKYGKPKLCYLFLAKKVLKKYLKEKDLFTQEENKQHFLDEKCIKNTVEKKLSIYGLANEYQIVFSKDFISRFAVNNKKKLIKIRLPITIKQNEMEAILNHEIDTHVLRQLNYERQPWFRKKKQNNFKAYLYTEEGLATVNELIASKHKLAYKSAINYLAVNLALKKDFVSVFNFINQILQDPEKAWAWTLKKKRGITDTNQKGAYTKDLVYFAGLVQVLHYLKKNHYDPSELYYGKLNLKDIGKARKLNFQKNLILPEVFTKNPKSYQQAVSKMIKNNLF